MIIGKGDGLIENWVWGSNGVRKGRLGPREGCGDSLCSWDGSALKSYKIKEYSSGLVP